MTRVHGLLGTAVLALYGVVFVLSPSNTVAGFCETLGDGDGDGDVDIVDASLALHVHSDLSTPVPCPESLADVYADGAVTSTDAQVILQFLEETVASIPVPLAAETLCTIACPSVSASSVTIATGQAGSVDIDVAGVRSYGLGSWTVDVAYDPEIIAPIGCEPALPAVCNIQYAPGVIRLAGALPDNRATGDFHLSTIVFQCLQTDPGHSVLTPTVPVFTSASPGTPGALSRVDVEEGVFSCELPIEADGDVNCTGETDAVDAALVLQYAAGLTHQLPCHLAADVNSDRRIDSVDALFILQASAHLIGTLPIHPLTPCTPTA